MTDRLAYKYILNVNVKVAPADPTVTTVALSKAEPVGTP
jgi:hypothetical protein